MALSHIHIISTPSSSSSSSFCTLAPPHAALICSLPNPNADRHQRRGPRKEEGGELRRDGAARELRRIRVSSPQSAKSGLDGGENAPPLASVLLGIAPLVYTDVAEGAGYSQASYYTSLGLFLLSLPGLWSLIKRSTKSKIVKKTFLVPGLSETDGKAPKQIAGEITSFFLRNNFEIKDRGDSITFEGVMVPSRGQAAFLTFCTCLSLASVALVLSITFPDVGDKWYLLTGLSPLAGVYYWTRASRKEQIKVKMVVADDTTSTDVIVQGDDEQVDSLRRELKFMEKGMIYVKGILER